MNTTNTRFNRPTPASFFKEALAGAKHDATVAQHKRTLHAACLRHPQVRSTYYALAKATPGATGAAPTSTSLYVSRPFVHVSDYSAQVDVGVTLRDLYSFKDAALLKLLDAFAAGDWDASSSDYAHATPNRDYRFKRTIDRPLDALRLTAAERRALEWLKENSPYNIPTELTLTVSVYAYVKADSDACRIEVVGVEEQVLRKEVKRIVCA